MENEKPSNPPQPQEPITLHAVGRPTRKRLGEAVEAAFLAKACSFDFPIAKPWGESRPYDFLLDSGHGFLRVQVKCATSHEGNRYHVRAGGNSALYTKDDIDFLVSWVMLENLWYVIPIEAIVPHTGAHLSPHNPQAQYEKYREAWCLLACSPKVRGRKDIPVLCRCRELPVRCAVCPHR